MGNELRLSVRNEVAAFETLTPAVSAFLAQHDVPPQAAYTVNLALEEIVMNLIRHAGGEPGDYAIDVSISLNEHRLVLCIDDDAPPFDPRTARQPELDKPLEEREPGGLGLHLVRSMVDGLDYRRIDGKNRLELEIGLDSNSASVPEGNE